MSLFIGKNLYTPKPGNLKSKHKIYGRRHAQDILILARVEEVGCKCPKPGRPSGNQVNILQENSIYLRGLYYVT